MPQSSVIPYEIAFVVLMLMVACLPGPILAPVSRVLILLYAPAAFALAVYYLAFRKDTWLESPSNGTVPDATRYSRATKRSSAAYVIINLVLLLGAKMLGVSYSSVSYNYVSLIVSTMITYMYDRCISTDDGLTHLKREPARTVLNSYLSFCSPSFMRYLIALTCEIALTIIISYYIGNLIPASCWLPSTLFRKSIVPVVVYSIIGGPLRFAWAYPTVSEAGRVPYLTAYIIAFTILAFITYASGRVDAKAAAGVLILIGILAMILQTGGLSNAPHEPDVFDDANAMPLWIMVILSTAVLISTLVIAYSIFVNYLKPYIIVVPKANDPSPGKRRENGRVRMRVASV